MSRPNLRNKRPEENDDFVASLGAAGGGHAYELNLAGNFANRMHFCTRYLCFFHHAVRGLMEELKICLKGYVLKICFCSPSFTRNNL